MWNLRKCCLQPGSQWRLALAQESSGWFTVWFTVCFPPLLCSSPELLCGFRKILFLFFLKPLLLDLWPCFLVCQMTSNMTAFGSSSKGCRESEFQHQKLGLVRCRHKSRLSTLSKALWWGWWCSSPQLRFLRGQDALAMKEKNMYLDMVLKCYLPSVDIKWYNEDHGQSRWMTPVALLNFLARWPLSCLKSEPASPQRPLCSILASWDTSHLYCTAGPDAYL